MTSIPDKLHGLQTYIQTMGYQSMGPALVTPVQKYLFSKTDQLVVFVIGIPIALGDNRCEM